MRPCALLVLLVVVGCSRPGQMDSSKALAGTWELADCQDIYLPATYEFRSNGTYSWRARTERREVEGRYFRTDSRLELQHEDPEPNGNVYIKTFAVNMADADTLSLKAVDEQYTIQSLGTHRGPVLPTLARWCTYRRGR